MRYVLSLLVVSLVACASSMTPAPGISSSVTPMLSETDWLLLEARGHPAAESERPAVVRFSLAESRMTGYGGCNTLSAGWHRDGEMLSISPVVSTRRACQSEALGRQEQDLVRALETTARFDIDRGVLTLRNADGIVARFRRR